AEASNRRRGCRSTAGARRGRRGTRAGTSPAEANASGSTCSRTSDSLASMPTETQTAQLWICTSCGFVYDPDEGDPDGGIPPGTPFDEIPDDWFCPVCGARKADFEPYQD